MFYMAKVNGPRQTSTSNSTTSRCFWMSSTTKLSEEEDNVRQEHNMRIDSFGEKAGKSRQNDGYTLLTAPSMVPTERHRLCVTV